MAQYTQLTTAELHELLERFGLGPPSRATAIDGGSANSSTLVRIGARDLVLTICDEKSAREIERLVELHALLRRHRFPVERYLAGSGTVEHHGKPVTLRTYADGEVVAQCSPEQLRAAGAALARLHAIPAPAGLPAHLAYGPGSFRELRELDHPFVRWLALRIPRLEAERPRDLPRGLIHGDLFADNLVFRGATLVAVLDFEEARHAELMFDLGMAIAGTCTREDRIDPAAARQLLRGYTSIRPLSPAERAAAPYYADLAATATAFWRFRQYHVRRPTPQRALHHEAMVRVAESVGPAFAGPSSPLAGLD